MSQSNSENESFLHRRKVSLDAVDSDGEDKLVDESNIAELMKRIPQGSDKTGTIFDSFLDTLPSKWRNWVIRVIFTILMCSGFGLAMYYGPLPLIFLTICVQVKCFQEIISIGYSVYRVHGLPWFRSLSWYMLIASNYFLFGERSIEVFTIVFKKNYFQPLVTYHRFISFMLYVIGFVWFVLSLVKKYYLRQFSLFAWTHVTLLIVVSCSYLIIQNMFEGLIWFIISVSIIVINDCMAYVFGFFCGKTPLIKLSPKKTWEGFIGGAVSTIILGMIISHFFAGFKFFTCPIESYSAEDWNFECTPSSIFQLTEYRVPEMLSFLHYIGFPKTIIAYPFVFHSLSLSLFGAIIGPFGGFFASGFKRAFKIKDFGDIIPGHGGIVDRFDCQYLMAVFVHVYIASFISLPNPEKIMRMIFQLKTEDQIHILHMLEEHLDPTSN